MDSWKINNSTLEYIDDTHTYLVDGVIVPSVTQILKTVFKNKYDFVAPAVLKSASEKGTATHKAIEDYCKQGIDDGSQELKNFRFLQKQYGFKVLENEVPVILWRGDEPICAGRLDMVIEMDGKIGGADIKRTSLLDKDYLGYQLNIYRLAYEQSYGVTWEFLRGIHLRNEVRKFVPIPINEELTMQRVDDFIRSRNERKNKRSDS